MLKTKVVKIQNPSHSGVFQYFSIMCALEVIDIYYVSVVGVPQNHVCLPACIQ